MSTLTELQQLLHEKFDIDLSAIPADAAMQESGMDSLAIAEFMFAVEDHFHITLPDDDPNINTLGQLADLVDELRRKQPAVLPSVAQPEISSMTEDK